MSTLRLGYDDRTRLTAFGGSASQSVGETFSSDSAYSHAYIEPFAGRYGGAQIAYEGQKLGLGIGVTRVSSNDQGTYPALYARLGNIDAPHFRVDAFSPDPAFPSVPWGRIGVGVNNGYLRSVGGFIGMGLGPPDYNTKAAFVGELHFPVAHRLTAQLHGLAGPGETHSQWSFGTGLQFDFGTRH
jgi:hypothetical protein